MKLTPYQHILLVKMNRGATLWRPFQSDAFWLETPWGHERVWLRTVKLLVEHGLIEERAGEFRTFYDLTDAGRAAGEVEV